MSGQKLNGTISLQGVLTRLSRVATPDEVQEFKRLVDELRHGHALPIGACKLIVGIIASVVDGPRRRGG